MAADDLPKIEDRLRVLSEERTAELLDVHPQTLRRYRRAGTGPVHIRLGPNRIGYRAGDIKSWQDERLAG